MAHLFRMRGAWGRSLTFAYTTFVVPGIKDIYEAGVTLLPPLDDGATVLDVGCGPGDLSRVIARARPGAKVIGLDLTPAMIAKARRNAAGIGNVSYREGDAMALPFEDGAMDLCVTTASIKHWPDEARGVAEIFRVLTPEGVAFVLEADRDCSLESAKNFISHWRWLMPGTRPAFVYYFRRIIASQGTDAASLQTLLKQAGFQDIEIGRLHGQPFVYATGKKPGQAA